MAIDQAHNAGLPNRRSVSYADDGIIADAEALLGGDLERYIELIVSCFGAEGFDRKKINLWEEMLITIGFELGHRRKQQGEWR